MCLPSCQTLPLHGFPVILRQPMPVVKHDPQVYTLFGLANVYLAHR